MDKSLFWQGIGSTKRLPGTAAGRLGNNAVAAHDRINKPKPLTELGITKSMFRRVQTRRMTGELFPVGNSFLVETDYRKSVCEDRRRRRKTLVRGQ